MIELTINEAKKHPASFMYVWANDKFLNAINPKHAKIIAMKKANQKKVLMLSADKYLGGFDKVDQYYNAISSEFEKIYGMKPIEALLVLAQGGEVAGKNWDEGVYGVGAIRTNEFKGVTASDGSSISVDATTGHIFYGNVDITDESMTVYSNVKGQVIPYQLFGKDDFGYIYMSQYNKTYKKYYAQSWTDDEGTAHKATTGNVSSASDGASIWGNINFDWDWIKNILNWLLSIFGIPTIPEAGSAQSDTLSADNTLPNQKGDGFVTDSNPLEAGAIFAALAAAGLLLSGGIKTKKSK